MHLIVIYTRWPFNRACKYEFGYACSYGEFLLGKGRKASREEN